MFLPNHDILKKLFTYCKGKGIVQSRPFHNCEIVIRILKPSGTLAMFDKQVEEHHLSFQKLITVLISTVQ